MKERGGRGKEVSERRRDQVCETKRDSCFVAGRFLVRNGSAAVINLF